MILPTPPQIKSDSVGHTVCVLLKDHPGREEISGCKLFIES